MHFHNEIKKVKQQQKILKKIKKLKSKLSEITTENPKYRDNDQLSTIKNIQNRYNSRQKVVKLYNNYAKIISEAMYKTKQGTGFKI